MIEANIDSLLYMSQDFNPIPYPVILANCVAWLVYGIVTDDYFVSASSEVGLMIGLFYTISVYGLAEEKVGLSETADVHTIALNSQNSHVCLFGLAYAIYDKYPVTLSVVYCLFASA